MYIYMGILSALSFGHRNINNCCPSFSPRSDDRVGGESQPGEMAESLGAALEEARVRY